MLNRISYLSLVAALALILTHPATAADDSDSNQPTTSEAGTTGTTSNAWKPDLPSALKTAKEEGKDIFVDISATWCKYCKHMERTVLPKPKVTEFLAKGFVAVKIDADSRLGKKLQSSYKVKGVPDLLVFNSDGLLKGKMVGAPTNANGFIQLVGDMAKGTPDSKAPSISSLASN